MFNANFVILYVANPLKSAEFYAGLIGAPADEASPGFAMFRLEGGRVLGLWKVDAVKPAATLTGGGSELALAVMPGDRVAIDARHADWAGRGIRIVQTPVDLDFGYTFTAEDPDGHRIRVFAPSLD